MATTDARVTVTDLEELVARARTLIRPRRRRILGITGAPGAGKSTLAQWLVRTLGEQDAVFVPMDGFHLSNRALAQLGRRDRKGAHDTFDSWGYGALLQRIKEQRDDAAGGVVWAPRFRRDLEEPVAGAIPVHADVPLVITEGNYLLLERDGWSHARGFIDEVWFLDPPQPLRIQRLIERHVRFGRSLDAATERSLGSDQRNALLIESTAARADLRITGIEMPPDDGETLA